MLCLHVCILNGNVISRKHATTETDENIFLSEEYHDCIQIKLTSSKIYYF